MNFFAIDKRKTGLMMLMFLLVFSLIAMEGIVTRGLRETALIQVGVDELVEYKGLDGTFEYKLPKSWKAEEKNEKINYVLYNNKFMSDSGSITGDVQVWNLEGELVSILENKKAKIASNNSFKEYTINETKINGMDAYLVSYIQTTNKVEYKGFEYYIKKGDKIYTAKFLINKNSYKENLMAIFKLIVESMNI